MLPREKEIKEEDFTMFRWKDRIGKRPLWINIVAIKNKTRFT